MRHAYEPQPRELDEERLLTRLKHGDEAAFEALIASIEAPLFGYVLSMVRNHAEAEEIAQETLLRLYQACRQGRVRRAPRSYAFSIAHNLAMDTQRRQLNIVPSPMGKPAPASARAEQSLLRAQIQQALAVLSEDHRSALLLREFGGLSYAEVASALGVSVDQVKVWIHRARKRLAEILDRDGQYLGEKKNGARIS